MEFLNETDMKSVQRVAIDLLIEEPRNLGSGFVLHPFVSDADVRVDGKYYNIFENNSLWKKWKALTEQYICSSDIDGLLMMITEPYRLSFLKKIANYLSRQDFSSALSETYTCGVVNKYCSHDEVLEWFKNADKEALMYESEKRFYDSLPDEVVIYRGQKADDEIDGISWSIDKNVAKKFAKRIVGGGCLLKAKVYKFDILAYFDRREEAEIIVDHENIFELKFLKK